MRIFTLFFTALFILCSIWVEAQTTTAPTSSFPKAKDFNTWELGFHIGATYPNTDLAASDLTEKSVKEAFAYGLNLNHFFSHSFAIQGRFLSGTLKGQGTQSVPGSYKTKINYQLSLSILGQVGNIGFLKHNPDWGFYGFVGIGFLNFSPTNYDQNGNELTHNIYQNRAGTRDSSVDYKNTNEIVIPFGLGIRYHFSKPLSAHVELAYQLTRTDKLDGEVVYLSNYDTYTYMNLGVTFHFGTKQRIIEWVNPLQTIYSELYDTKEKVDMMSADSDHDGIPDMFDKDNSTPKDVKVYGDGTAIDSDGDGIPDYKDAEPFSVKGAKVDSLGREPDSDGDGVPDSRDVEPNTPKGALVNFQGVSIFPNGRESSGGVAVSTGYIPAIYFDFNSSVISPKFSQLLANIALVLIKNPSVKFEIQGNADKRGKEDYNNKLALKRAEAIKNHLVKWYNIDPSRLRVVSNGKSQPITPANEFNRRADFNVFK